MPFLPSPINLFQIAFVAVAGFDLIGVFLARVGPNRFTDVSNTPCQVMLKPELLLLISNSGV